MTTEEKARAYDEALERAREFQKSKDGLCVLTAESIFPELAESEDEKALRIIRKRMCYDPVPISDEDRRIVENWLEKQKEQKPVEKAAFTPVDKELTEFEKAVVKLCQIGKDEYPCYEFAKKYAPSLLDLAKKEFEKPAEWSEEDDLNCNRIIRFLEPHKTFFPTKETKEEMQNWIKTRLKSLRPSWKPSEEQLKYLLMLADYFESEGGTSNAKTLREFHEQLKKL